MGVKTRQPIWRFFAGKPIERYTFFEICASLDLDWQIESFQRAVKQVANIERFFVRQTVAISNHIFAAISAFVHLQLLCIHDLITNSYALKRNLFNDVIHSFIVKNLVDCSYLLPANLLPSVNA